MNSSLSAYSTVSGVNGPLVILDNVKVRLKVLLLTTLYGAYYRRNPVFIHFQLLWKSIFRIYMWGWDCQQYQSTTCQRIFRYQCNAVQVFVDADLNSSWCINNEVSPWFVCNNDLFDLVPQICWDRSPDSAWWHKEEWAGPGSDWKQGRSPGEKHH